MGSPAGPSNPTPPGGPGRSLWPGLAAFLDRSARADRAIAAELAGARGQSADPLHPRRRERNYQRQNGTERLTPRQRRRAEHKARHAAVRGTAA